MTRKKLTPAQADLFAAMERGAVVFFCNGINSYYFRSDNMRSCTKQASGLVDKGWAIKTNVKFTGHELAIKPDTGDKA